MRFSVLLHNVQPGVRIDYATGASREDAAVQDATMRRCVANEASRVFHRASCPTAARIAKGARRRYEGPRQALESEGYEPCKHCRP